MANAGIKTNAAGTAGVLTFGTQDVVEFDGEGLRPLDTQEPCFGAWSNTASSATSAANVPLLLDQEEFDPTGAFNPVTARFTPLVAGYYQINARAQFATSNYSTAVVLLKNGALVKWGDLALGVSVGSWLVYLNGTTDYINIGTYSATTQNTATGQTLSFVSGFLVRRA